MRNTVGSCARAVALAKVLTSMLTLASSAAHAEDKTPVLLELQVRRLEVGHKPAAFDNVGLFEVRQGDTPLSQACRSKSDSAGKVQCRWLCSPEEGDEQSLLVVAPGADRVPGYESPASQELKLATCVPDKKLMAFNYLPLEVAFNQVMASEPELAQAVVGSVSEAGASTPFASARLKPFESAAPTLQALALKGNPQLLRFNRIMHDWNASMAAQPMAAASTQKERAQAYAAGTSAVLLYAAAEQSLGKRQARVTVPISGSPFELAQAQRRVGGAVASKQVKTNFDSTLLHELAAADKASKARPASADDSPALDWDRLRKVAVEAKPLTRQAK